MNGKTSFLADLIAAVHALIVLFVVLAPLSNIPYVLLLHTTFAFSLLVHWYFNSNMCSLSIIESKLRGLDYTESFTHKLISPIYDISKTTWSNICYTITLILLCISAYKLYTSSKWKEAWKCYETTKNKILQSQSTFAFHEKCLLYSHCFYILFT